MSLTDKILNSGLLIDKHTTEMLEKWGYLREGSSDKVNEDALKNATKGQLAKLADEIDVELDKELRRRETQLDLDKIRWPAVVDIYRVAADSDAVQSVALQVSCVMDKVGRYYFRIQEASPTWFVPGYIFKRSQRRQDDPSGVRIMIREMILEAQTLYVGDSPVCVQVTTSPA